MSRSIRWIWMALMAGLPPAAAQDMPYSLAYTFTAITVSPDGLTVTSISVANTYGSSGHTAAAMTSLRAPGGRSAAANMYHDFQSSATTFLPVCDEWSCEDGEWVAEGGGEEYCPIAMAYLAVAATQDRKETPPVIQVVNVSVNPGQIPMQNGRATLYIKAIKSPRCPGDDVVLFGSFNAPSGMLLKRDPESGLVRPQWVLDSATGEVKINTTQANFVSGTVLAAGGVDSAPGCEIKGTLLTTQFTVQ